MSDRTCAARFRRLLWRAVCGLVGGLTVRGRAPAAGTGPGAGISSGGGGLVLVANHRSHADTAALLAALPAASRPVFVAAADYWWEDPLRRAAAAGLAGILPVRRGEGGGYPALHAAAGPALAAGRTVVIYPEGTRGTGDTVGAFRSGAVALARDCGVSIAPVGLVGTGDVLAKHGRLRAAPMEVRFGPARPATATDAAALRAEVVGLLAAGPARARTSPLWRRVARLVGSRRGLVVAFCWGLAEALSWPLMAETTLVFLAAAVPARIPAMAGALVTGSLTGVLGHAWLSRSGVSVPAPLTTARMRAAALEDLAGGPSGMLGQALSGVPVKLYARAAGELGLDPWSLLLWAGIERGLRMGAVAVLVWLLARRLHGWLRRCYGTYLVLTGLGAAAALAAVVTAWS